MQHIIGGRQWLWKNQLLSKTSVLWYHEVEFQSCLGWPVKACLWLDTWRQKWEQRRLHNLSLSLPNKHDCPRETLFDLSRLMNNERLLSILVKTKWSSTIFLVSNFDLIHNIHHQGPGQYYIVTKESLTADLAHKPKYMSSIWKRLLEFAESGQCVKQRQNHIYTNWSRACFEF